MDTQQATQTTVDPIIIGTKVIDAYQSIVSRYVDPQEPVVLSVTQFHGGDAYNVIPNEVEIKGCTRCFHQGSKSARTPNGKNH